MFFPNDSDGNALKMIYEAGADFSKTYIVDFFIAVVDKNSGEKISKEVQKHGFDCALEQDDESKDWTCYCSKRMMLVYEDIIRIQELLDEISKPYGGYSDGWGVLGG